jgi:hypothetical protein
MMSAPNSTSTRYVRRFSPALAVLGRMYCKNNGRPSAQTHCTTLLCSPVQQSVAIDSGACVSRCISVQRSGDAERGVLAEGIIVVFPSQSQGEASPRANLLTFHNPRPSKHLLFATIPAASIEACPERRSNPPLFHLASPNCMREAPSAVASRARTWLATRKFALCKDEERRPVESGSIIFPIVSSTAQVGLRIKVGFALLGTDSAPLERPRLVALTREELEGGEGKQVIIAPRFVVVVPRVLRGSVG